ncbi:IclR family transcriptional regulator [Ramlibacter henchirensis]|uniref:IclR family transcriptional regulator n=1 Tax=Ramlibacter henchirensis TaxID=204072 RepID=UPI001431D76A|nr:IclR family transcriptional regulator [Ramlibacter henchirensis]
MATVQAARGGGVDAVEVVGTILQALLHLPRPARLKDLEDATGIPSAKLHRYLVSMARCGLVTREEGSRRYQFGLLTYRIGQVASHEQSALSLLEPRFEAFSARLDKPELGQVVGLGQWVGHGATIVRWFESSSPLSIRMKPGVGLGITSSATAKLLAAYLPRESTEALVRQELLEQGRAANSAVEAVYAEYAAIRKAQIASSHGARRRGLNALSVPLFDHEDKVVAAVTVLGMGPQFEALPGSSAGKRLRQLGRELSALLGQGAPAKAREAA